MTARLASFFCLLVAVPAAANVAASSRTPAAFTLSPGTARTRSEVLGEKLSFDCSGAEREEACRFEARYRLRNGTSEAEVIDAAFLGIRVREVSVEFDGEQLPVAEGQVDPPESAPGTGDAAQAPPSPEEALGRLARTSQIFIIPSLGLGVGVPVQVLPEARPGLRLLVDLHFGPVGAALSWDHHPRLREGSDTFSRLALLLQVGL